MKRVPASSISQRRPIARGRRSAKLESAATSWITEHRGKPAIKPPPSAGRAASRLLRPMSQRFGPGVSELEAHWAEIVGDQLAAYTRPEKFQGGARGATLVIRARGPAAALAEAQAPRILERVGRYSGKSPARLKIVQGPLTQSGAPAQTKPSRIRKVRTLDPGPQTLDDILETWRRAVESREGVSLPPSAPRDHD